MITKYEKARIIGARAFQLALNAKPMVKEKVDDPVLVAIKEFEKGKTPLSVKKS